MTTLEHIELEKCLRETLYAYAYKFHAYEICCWNNNIKAAKRYYSEFEVAIEKHYAIYRRALSVCPIFKQSYTIDHIVYDWLGIFPLKIKEAAYHQAEADFKNSLMNF